MDGGGRWRRDDDGMDDDGMDWWRGEGGGACEMIQEVGMGDGWLTGVWGRMHMAYWAQIQMFSKGRSLRMRMSLAFGSDVG